MVSALRCPVCNGLVDPAKTPALPFCSQRCRQIDLSRWLDEKYSMPVEREDDDPDEEPPPAE